MSRDRSRPNAESERKRERKRESLIDVGTERGEGESRPRVRGLIESRGRDDRGPGAFDGRIQIRALRAPEPRREPATEPAP